MNDLTIQDIVNNLEGMSVTNEVELDHVRLVKAQVQAMGIMTEQLKRIADALENINSNGIGTEKVW